MATPAGPLDALFINRHGALGLVKCKLWRNPQARREVVGQILDYAKELARWPSKVGGAAWQSDPGSRQVLACATYRWSRC
jgi:hypothetical protein